MKHATERSSIDNRLHPRISLQCSVILANDNFVTEGTVLNLGVAGCAVASDKTPARGEYVELDLRLPDQKQALRVPVAKVRWVEKGRCGVEFLKFTWEHEIRLGHLVGAYKQQGADQPTVGKANEASQWSRFRSSTSRFMNYIRTRLRLQ